MQSPDHFWTPLEQCGQDLDGGNKDTLGVSPRYVTEEQVKNGPVDFEIPEAVKDEAAIHSLQNQVDSAPEYFNGSSVLGCELGSILQ